MRFTDLLRAGVLLSAASSTVLATSAVAFGFVDGQQDVVLLCTIWWLMASVSAQLLANSRGGRPTAAIGRLLADAKPQRTPEQPRVASTVASRLWPLGLATLLGLLGTAAFGPQVAGIGAGFPLVWALLWRGQESAVKAVEERDGVVFHVVVSGPLKPIRLVRGPGLRRDLPSNPKSERTVRT
ncbi:MAG: hypothetical protein JHD16_14950 [Solirubrobacteraceae bacterium]|nr:hypothetical protein [Solirubrobacteraceae bacterium]